MLKNKKIYLAGHNGHVGTAILKKLKHLGYKKVIIADRKKLDLTNQSQVFKFLKKIKPFLVIIAAARVGGIVANHSIPNKTPNASAVNVDEGRNRNKIRITPREK